MSAPDALRAMLHEMAQPAAVASLAVDVACREIQQGNMEAAHARLAAAADQLVVLQGLFRRHAGVGAAAADPTAVLLRDALQALMRTQGQAGLRCRVEPAEQGKALRIHLAGGAAPDAALRPWLDLLRAAGAAVRCRRVRRAPGAAGATGRVWIDIGCPPGGGRPG